MYHYRECGLPHVYLANGYKEITGPSGKGVAISDLPGLHFAIASSAVRERKHLTGPEVRFIRKYLELTQAQFAQMLGVEEQTVRLWEKRPRAPLQADRAVRLLFLNLAAGQAAKPMKIDAIVAQTLARVELTKLNLRYRATARDKWVPELLKVA